MALRRAALKSPLSASVRITSRRRRRPGVKYSFPARVVSASKVVAVRELPPGGGRSIPTERPTVAWNTASSEVGNRLGRARSVKEATPAGTSGIAERSASAAAFARARRLGPAGDTAANIEREMSSAKIASASVRT